MADSGQEKTEQPTAKKRRDARQKGNVFQSRDVATVVLLAGIFSFIRIMISYIYGQVRTYMVWILQEVTEFSWDALSKHLAYVTLMTFIRCAFPLLLVALVLGVLAHGVQTRFNVSFEKLRPNFGKLNPISGIKKLFSLKNLVELLKSSIKIVLILVLLYNIIKKDLQPMASMIDMNPAASAVYMMKMIYDLILRVGLAFTVIAFADFFYQRWDYEKELRMTKQEVKDEYKQTEGNPEIKNRIRSIQRQMATSRMMQKVPQADVVIRNPTHVAVAIKYNPDQDHAPVVLAKGLDDLALRIVKVAEENQIATIENKPLARAMYASCELDQPIPAEFYTAVAEILVYLYKQDGEGGRLEQLQGENTETAARK